MTNEEAIDILQSMKSKDCYFEQNEALEMAISALSQMESAGTQITNSNLKSESEIKVDLIRREAVLDTLDRMNKALDTDRTVEQYHKLLKACFEVLPAYSANLVKESGALVKDLVKDEDLISRKAVLDCQHQLTMFGHSKMIIDVSDIEQLPTYSAEQSYSWCKGCKEYDTEKHCCHRYSSFIRESLQENINAVLEEIEEELQTLADDEWNQKVGVDKGLEFAIEIIDNHING